ncbi:MAG TPA: hypothetical protein VFZ77_00610 [Acidimicrobiales bacterium]
MLADWTRNAALLDDLWSSLGEDQCGVTVTEPPVGDGFRWIVSVDGDRVRSAPAGPTVARARATISGTRRDLLALLLGRRRRRPLEIDGDLDFGAAFERAFPGPDPTPPRRADPHVRRGALLDTVRGDAGRAGARRPGAPSAPVRRTRL